MKPRHITSDVVIEKLSDHYPLIHHHVLFWNIMMQGRMRRDQSFNNGFGIVESESQYLKRLTKIANYIIELITAYPEIDVITLCEGPILLHHQQHFAESFMSSPVMHRFLAAVTTSPQSETYPNWGLCLLPDKKYNVSPVTIEGMAKLDEFPQLANRLELWKLTVENREKFIGLAHLPFNQSLSSGSTKRYQALISSLLNDYQDKDFTFCADFNFNPYLLDEYRNREADFIPVNNSMLITEQQHAKREIAKVTVDGILLSALNKQRHFDLKFNPGLFGRLQREWGFTRQYVEEECQKMQENQLQICGGFSVL